VSWDDRFAEPIVLDDGTKLATLRQAIAHLAKFIPKAERNLPEVMTKAAEQGGPVEFARIATLQAINRVRSPAQRHQMRRSQGDPRLMTDREVVIQAIEEAKRILAEYIEPGRRDAVATVKALLDLLDRREVGAALNRLKAGYGLYEVRRCPPGEPAAPEYPAGAYFPSTYPRIDSRLRSLEAHTQTITAPPPGITGDRECCAPAYSREASCPSLNAYRPSFHSLQLSAPLVRSARPR
jgi:hypothetical protein